MDFIKLVIFFSALLFFTSTCEAKKRCKPLLEKLHNIQALQRSGYSSQRGTSLRAREDKAREKWWQCEQGQSKNKKRSKGKSKSHDYSSAKKQAKQKKILAGTPFKTNNSVVVKSKYHGQKKQAWIKFYKQPTQCSRPKSLAIFASCSEDKQAQRLHFEQVYE